MNTVHRAFRSCASVLTLAALCCTGPNPVEVAAGGSSTEIPNGVVMGYARSSTGIAVPGARVVLYSVNQNGTDTSTAVDSTITDDGGAYTLHAKGAGTYQATVLSSDSAQVAVGAVLTILGSQDTVSDEGILKPASRVTGIADVALSDIMTATVSLRGTPFACRVDEDSRFALPLVPSGTYELWCTVRDTAREYCLAEKRTIVVPPEGLTVDSLRIPSITDRTGELRYEDFDDGLLDNNPYCIWSTESTPTTPTPVQVTSFGLDSSGADRSTYCLHTSYVLDSLQQNKWLSIKSRLYPQDDDTRTSARVVDMSRLASVSFWARGTGHRLSVNVHTKFRPGVFSLARIDSLPPTWTYFTVNVDSLVQDQDPWDRRDWDVGKHYAISIQFPITWPKGTASAKGDVWIDDIRLTFK